LRTSPFLRGLYFTGIRLVETAPAPAPSNWTSPPSAVFKTDATSIFRPEATEIFRPGMEKPEAAPSNQGMKPQWMFAKQLFEEVVPFDRAAQRAAWQREPDRGQPVEEFLLTGLRAVLDHLRAHDPAEDCPTWWPERQNYGFWYRRLAHEATVHRVDIQQAAGIERSPVPDDVAVDGVAEGLSLWFTHRLAVLGVRGTRHARVRIRTGGREWLARATPTGTSAWAVGAEREPADGAVSGDPEDVYLWLWGRIPPQTQSLQREGSEDAIAQLWALLRLATR